MKKPPRHLFGYDSWIEMYDTFCNENPDIMYDESKLMKVTLNFQYMTSPDEPVKRYKISMKQLMINCWKEFEEVRMEKERSIIAEHHIQRNTDNFHQEYVDDVVKLLRVAMVRDNLD